MKEMINDIRLEEIWKNICEQRDDTIIWSLWWAIQRGLNDIRFKIAMEMLKESDLI